jgi:hypothetical protein
VTVPKELRHHWRAVLAATLAVIVAGSALVWRLDDDEGSADPVSVARAQAHNIFSVDYREADQGTERVLELASGSFKKQYAAERDTVVADAQQRKLVVSASVPHDGAAIEYLRDEHAQVLVAIDVATTANGKAAPDGHYRARIELTMVDDEWLVSDVSEVGDGSDPLGTLADDDGGDAVAVAAEVIPLAFAYDYENLDQGLDSATDGMTDSFAAEFRHTFDKTARPMAEDTKAVAQAEVRGGGVVSRSSDRVVCLFFLDQVLVSSSTMDQADGPGEVSKSRLRVVLEDVDDTWKVDAIEPF